MSKGREMLILLGLVLILTAFESFGLTMLTAYARDKHQHSWKLIAGLVMYGLIVPFLIIRSLNYEGIAMVNLIWNIMSTTVVILIGYYVFRERLTNLHIVSMLFAFAAGITLYFADKK